MVGLRLDGQADDVTVEPAGIASDLDRSLMTV